MALTNVFLWGAALGASGEESHGFSLMDIHVGTIFWTLVIFLIVLVVLGKLVWKPILKAVGERENRIRDSLEQADQAQAESEKILAEQKQLGERQRKDASEFLAKAKDDAQRVGADILAKARKEAEEQTDRARRQIEEEKVRALGEVRGHAVEIALEAAGHLLGKTLNAEAQRAIVRDYIDKLPESLKPKH